VRSFEPGKTGPSVQVPGFNPDRHDSSLGFNDEEENMKPGPTNVQKRVYLAVAMILASPLTQGADLAAGKELAKAKNCTECHGLSGNKGVESYPPVPKLAGQPRAYLVKVMKEFRSGVRIDETMNLMMKPRSDEEIELLADYFAAQKRY
jgi:cytochrome c553